MSRALSPTLTPYRLMGLCLIAFALFYIMGNKQQDHAVGPLMAQSEQQLATLATLIANKELQNIRLIDTYSKTLKEQKAELSEVVEVLAKEGTTQSALYRGLTDRLETVKQNLAQHSLQDGEVRQTLQTLIQASQPSAYNDSLLDVVNMLADMSAGILPRIQAPAANGKHEQLATQLVGNPNYGTWRQEGGMSFWEWYGAYSLFRNLFGGARYRYDNWVQQRPWSYYNDVGRDNFRPLYDVTPKKGASSQSNTMSSTAVPAKETTDRRVSTYSKKANPFMPSYSTPSRVAPPISNDNTTRRRSSYTMPSQSGSKYNSYRNVRSGTFSRRGGRR